MSKKKRETERDRQTEAGHTKRDRGRKRDRERNTGRPRENPRECEMDGDGPRLINSFKIVVAYEISPKDRVTSKEPLTLPASIVPPMRRILSFSANKYGR